MKQTYQVFTVNGVIKSYPTDPSVILEELIAAVTAQPISVTGLAHALYDALGFALYLGFGQVPATDIASFLQQLTNFLANFQLPAWAGPLVQSILAIVNALVKVPVMPPVNPPVG